MENKFMLELLISIAIFAPGIILLAGCFFLGTAMLIEKMRPTKVKKEMPTTTNPSAGSIVGALNESLQEGAGKKNQRKTS